MSMFSIKKINNIHLKAVLIVPFITLTVLAVGFVGYLSFRNGQKAVNDVAYQLQSEISKRIEGHLHAFLSTPQQINQLNAISIQQGRLNVNNPTALERHFWQQVRIFKFVSSIYFGNTLGGLVNSGREGAVESRYVIVTDHFKSGAFKKFITDTQGNRTDLLITVQNFDARTRQWYSGAVEKSTDIWSSVYILFTGQDMAVAASRPVYDEQHKLLGVVSVDLFLSHISKFLQSLTIGKKGHAFVIERSGLLIASSSKDKLFTESGENKKQRRLNVSESTSPMIQYAAESIRQRFGAYHNITNEQKIVFKIAGQRHFLQVSPMHEFGLDWLIAVVISEEDFMAQIKENNRLTAILIITTLLIVMLIGVFIAQKIAEPILLLNTAAQNLAKGKWKKEIRNNSRFVEINVLIRSFNQMAGQLQHTLNNLYFEIAERKQAEKEREKLIKELQQALENIEILSGLVPICATCKKIRDDKGYWNVLEDYIETHSTISFSHGICPECLDELYGTEDWYIEMKKNRKQK